MVGDEGKGGFARRAIRDVLSQIGIDHAIRATATDSPEEVVLLYKSDVESASVRKVSHLGSSNWLLCMHSSPCLSR